MSDELGLLIVGGGPAGLSAARGYRAAGGEGDVAIVTDEHRMPYRRPPLTKDLLRGEITEDALDLEEESWLAEHRVALISGRAVALNPDAHEVVLSGGRTLPYARCVLATGAEPTRPPIPGADDPGVRVVRALDDVRELLVRLSAGRGRVAVIGSGFIGCEVASSLRRRGAQVRLLSDEPAPNTTRLGPDAAAEIERWLAAEGVELELGRPVESISRAGAELRVVTAAGGATADVVVMATGVAPRSELLAPSGLRLEHGAIPVDGAMRTTLPDLLAAGDVCQALNVAAGRPLRVEHWGDALAQGELAGRSAAGQAVAWAQVPGFWSTIGEHTLKYAAWGDGHDHTRLERHGDGAFSVWYGREGTTVGVLTHRCDEAYERGRELIAGGAGWAA
ncbi:MAG TPA: FAD-dependent oxidoreductase [Solirubrobacteraceae bacterium]|nr:FAD-dependent oxidoreductase [Solirubrobacteraceae bacterium]